jgi:hypothetical protein
MTTTVNNGLDTPCAAVLDLEPNRLRQNDSIEP